MRRVIIGFMFINLTLVVSGGLGWDARFTYHFDPSIRTTSENGVSYGGPVYDYDGKSYPLPNASLEGVYAARGQVSRDGTVIAAELFLGESSPDFSRFVEVWRKVGPIDGSTPDQWEYRRERPSLLSGYTASTLGGMSDNGAFIVGACHDGNLHDFAACLWDTEGEAHHLGSIRPGGNNLALSISDGGVIVGFEWYYDLGIQTAFIWDQASGIRDLQSVLNNYGRDFTGWHLTEAYAINPQGTLITGYGFDPSGQYAQWSAVIPEPSSVILIGIGGLWMRRRNPCTRH